MIKLANFAKTAASLFFCGMICFTSAPEFRAVASDAPANSSAQKGVQIEFNAMPIPNTATSEESGSFEEFDISFKIKDVATQQPLSGRRPGAWIDSGAALDVSKSDTCKEKIDSFLRTTTGARPIVDLTSYYILAFNRDASISVIDPLVGIKGRTNLFSSIALAGAPGDWAKSPDAKRLYVTMPSVDKVAVIDAESFKLIREIDAGLRPMRIVLSADGRYIFVANDSDTENKGGVTIIDVVAYKKTAHIPTGRGHHEISLSQGGEFLFISNRGKGDVIVIDVATLKIVNSIQTGTTPLSLAYSQLSEALYVADGTDGTVTIIDGRTPHIIGRITAQPGLGSIVITPDGRWALVLNAERNSVHVIEIATNRLVQDIRIGTRPYQIALSDAFAYVVSLDSENIGMISLKELGKPTAEQISTFSAGASPPVAAMKLGIGASIAKAVDDAAVIVANPADNIIYYYMEGMLAPSGSFLNPGRELRAVGVIDHGLKETAPGVYSARAKLPRGAVYQAAILLDSPKAFDCFPLLVAQNPAPAPAEVTIDYLETPATTQMDETLIWRFRVSDRKKFSREKASVICFSLSGSRHRIEIPALEAGDGVYEVQFAGLSPGAYYVYVAIPSWNVNYGDLPPRNLLVQPGK